MLNYCSCCLYMFILWCCCYVQGYLVNWDVQRKVWDHLFGKEMFKVMSSIHLYFFCCSKATVTGDAKNL